jgi:hypothetical protein
VNAEIVRQGYGHAYTKYPFKVELMDLFRAYEKQAREAGRGLWASADPIDGKDTKAPKPEPKDAAKGEVYLTASGTKYHADGCRFLAKSKIPRTLADAKAKEFEPCSVCKPPEETSIRGRNPLTRRGRVRLCRVTAVRKRSRRGCRSVGLQPSAGGSPRRLRARAGEADHHARPLRARRGTAGVRDHRAQRR